MPRPHDPGSRPKGPRQTNPHARGRIKSQGNSRRPSHVEARGSSCNLAETKRGSANKPSVQMKKTCEGQMKGPGHPRQRQTVQNRARGFATNTIKGTEPVTVQGFEGWASKRFRQPPQGNRVRDDFGASLRMAQARTNSRSGRPKSCPRPAGKYPNGIPP